MFPPAASPAKCIFATTLCCAPCLFRSARERLCVFIILLVRSKVQFCFSRSAKSAVEISKLMTMHSFDGKKTGRPFPIPNYTNRRSALQQAAAQISANDNSGFRSLSPALVPRRCDCDPASKQTGRLPFLAAALQVQIVFIGCIFSFC